MRDLFHNHTIKTLLAPQVMGANITSHVVDLRGCETVTIACLAAVMAGEVQAGAGASAVKAPTLKLKLQHSADDESYSDVGKVDLLGAGILDPKVLDATNPSLITFGYTGGKRFVRVAFEKAEDEGKVCISALAYLGYLRQVPVNVAGSVN